MADLRTMDVKIKELEERLRRIEERLGRPANVYDQVWMDELYRKAKELVIKHNKASAIFIQKRLLIDFERATKLVEELEANGVIGPATADEPRKVLGK